MQIDLGNALAAEASPGVSRASLERLDEQVATAHDHIQRGRDANDDGYAALNLPTTTDPTSITTVAEDYRDADAILTIGIGGSALGASTLTDALPTDIPHYALDNVDPAAVDGLLDRLPLGETVMHVVSRSGTTVETLANFLIVRDAMTSVGVDWTDRTVVTTGPDGPLARLADHHGLPTLPVPTNVPGRFSVLSPVGLFAPAVAGCDIDAILTGASDIANSLSPSLFECAPYAYGAINEALARRGTAVTVMMPYAESLERFAEWFAQLWAESLGKDALGQIPAKALGVTDQHSQLQRYRAGPRNVLVTFIQATARPAVEIPDSDLRALNYLGGTTLEDLMAAELAATEASLADANRPNVRIDLDRIAPENLGRLLYAMEAACIMAAELQGTNAFDQPAVEWGKQATRDLLTDTDSAAAAAIDEKTSFIV